MPRTCWVHPRRTTRGHLSCYDTSKRRTEVRLTFRRLAISLLLTLDFRALTPLVWEHVNPYGRYELDMDARLAL